MIAIKNPSDYHKIFAFLAVGAKAVFTFAAEHKGEIIEHISTWAKNKNFRITLRTPSYEKAWMASLAAGAAAGCTAAVYFPYPPVVMTSIIVGAIAGYVAAHISIEICESSDGMWRLSLA